MTLCPTYLAAARLWQSIRSAALCAWLSMRTPILTVGSLLAWRRHSGYARSSFAAPANENDLRMRNSYRFEKLKGNRSADYSIRLNDQFRLVFQIEKEQGGNCLVILDIEDYH